MQEATETQQPVHIELVANGDRTTIIVLINSPQAIPATALPQFLNGFAAQLKAKLAANKIVTPSRKLVIP